MARNMVKIAEQVEKILNTTDLEEDSKEGNREEKMMDLYKKRHRLNKFLENT